MNRTMKKELTKQMAKLISQSESWILLRKDSKNQIHFHAPDEDHLFLLCEFVSRSPLIYEMINEFVNELNSEYERTN